MIIPFVLPISYIQVVDDLASCSAHMVESSSSKMHTNGTSVTGGEG